MMTTPVLAPSNRTMTLVLLGLAAWLAVLTAGAGWLATRASRPPAIVAFDTTKFLNAQRAAASALLAGKSDVMALTAVSAQAAERIAAVARDVAGPGAIIVSKQAFVLPADVPDITDRVLVALGLPTNAPSVSALRVDPPVADTDFAWSADYQQREALLSNMARQIREEARRDARNQLVP